jgi:hypothetical protein
MSSAVELAVHHYVAVLVTIFLLANVVIVIRRQPVSANKAASWPVTEATIQTMRVVYVPDGRATRPLDVGDFSYTVSDEYYSGTLAVSSSFSTGNAAPRDLINHKIQLRYNPHKPEQFSVPQQEIGGFLLDPYDGAGLDEYPMDLNINKV